MEVYPLGKHFQACEEQEDSREYRGVFSTGL